MTNILEVVRRDYDGLVRVVEHPDPDADLYILNYTVRCQYEAEWDWITRQCRGLIVDGEGNVVARPFRKFFNLGEAMETMPSRLPLLPFTATEKIDGSLGILYRLHGEPRVATRGSFDSPQAEFGTWALNRLDLSTVPETCTLLFEIVCNYNLSVVQYDYEGLVLLAAFDYVTGQEYTDIAGLADALGARTARVYTYHSVDEAVHDVEAWDTRGPEGLVLRFANGLRVKLKSPTYREAHTLVWSLSDRHVLELLRSGEYSTVTRLLPRWARRKANEIAERMRERALVLMDETNALFDQAPKATRKEFALWVQSHAPAHLHPALYRRFDGRPVNWYEVLQKGT